MSSFFIFELIDTAKEKETKIDRWEIQRRGDDKYIILFVLNIVNVVIRGLYSDREELISVKKKNRKRNASSTKWGRTHDAKD